VGWNAEGLRTTGKTAQMLRTSHCHVSALSGDVLVGFGRILGDAYVGQILDVITRPSHRRQGIATGIVRRLLQYAEGRYLGLSLIDGSGVEGFYERFGFEAADVATNRLMFLTRPAPVS
jgi:GNAT superfamily N-acetyltransferase